MESNSPSKLICQLINGSQVDIDMFKVLKVYCIFNIDKPVSVFYNRDDAERELKLIRLHMLQTTGSPPDTHLDKTIQFHLVEICMPALYFLMENILNG
jgi:hypothetical protein